MKRSRFTEVQITDLTGTANSPHYPRKCGISLDKSEPVA